MHVSVKMGAFHSRSEPSQPVEDPYHENTYSEPRIVEEPYYRDNHRSTGQDIEQIIGETKLSEQTSDQIEQVSITYLCLPSPHLYFMTNRHVLTQQNSKKSISIRKALSPSHHLLQQTVN